MGCCKENGDNESKVPGPRATTRVKQARHLGDKMQGETHSPVWILHLSNRKETQLLHCAPGILTRLTLSLALPGS